MQIETISGSQFPKIVIPYIENAKQSIDIIVYDWRWYASDPGSSCQLFNQAIVRARIRGVKVRAIVNSDEIKIPLQQNKIEVKKLISAKLLHTKLMIIDNNTVITGSHNYSESAFNINLELSVKLMEIFDIYPFKNYFDSLWLK